jgi:hypothetical protein
MIPWISKNKTFITSLIIWNHIYEPYQVIVLRKEEFKKNHLIYYFQLDHGVVANQQSITTLRTDTQAEINFHVTRLAREFLDSTTVEQSSQSSDAEPSIPNDELKNILQECFLSPIAIDIMKEKEPEFGFYSISPNFKKLEKILLGTYQGLLGMIMQIKNKK